MSLRPLFVTQVYEASLAASPGFESFNAGLAEACRMLAYTRQPVAQIIGQRRTTGARPVMASPSL